MPEVRRKSTGKTVGKFDYTPEGESSAGSMVAGDSDLELVPTQKYAVGGFVDNATRKATRGAGKVLRERMPRHKTV